MEEDRNKGFALDKPAPESAERDSFNAAEEANEIRRLMKLRKKRRFRYGKLMPHIGELVSLRREGLSYRQLALWLRQMRGVEVDHSWIKRALDQVKKGGLNG